MKKRHSLLSRLFASSLSVMMAFSLMPSTAFAAEIDSAEPSVVVEQPAEEAVSETAETTEAAEETVSETPEEAAEVTSDESVVSEEAMDEESDEAVLEAADDGGTDSPTEELKSVAIGEVTYYYADVNGDDEDTVYQATVSAGRGQTNTVKYSLADLTTLNGTDYAYLVISGTALSGNVYAYTDGTAQTYKDVYEGKVTSLDDAAYDAVSSATKYDNFHKSHIPSIVTFGTDANGDKAITGLNTGRGVEFVGTADEYVTASILVKEGKATDEQTALAAKTLKANPCVGSTDTKKVSLSTASYSSSCKYGNGEFVIVPDDTVEGYVWNEYWNNLYAATISDGTTTVGAVHWVDLYGEKAESGYHYNKVELALNNGTSVGENKATVSRYAAFYDTNTGNIKAGTYTITLYSDGYEDLTAEVTIPSEEMASVTVGGKKGITYYYADTTDDAANTVYTATVRSRGGSTIYNYTKADLTAVADDNYSNYCYVAAYDATPLSGDVYGYTDGTIKTYKDVYKYKVTSKTLKDQAYDAVSSATAFTNGHADDISSIVTYGTDGEGNKVITGLNKGRGVEKIATADEYVTAGILTAAGVATTDQAALAAKDMKANPTVGESEDTKEVSLASASYSSTSGYGDGEFVIVPDDTVDGYVWNEYWNNLYAATISNGKTIAGAVHWIDLYGENSTSGYHYNKVELALNNGTTPTKNAATVTRFSAFFDDNNNVKPGTYTITLYADGYDPLVARVNVDYTASVETEYNTAVAFDQAAYTTASYAALKTEMDNASALMKTEASKADAAAEVTALQTAENALVQKTAATISISAKTAVYNGKAVAVAKATTNSNGTVTYNYYSDAACTKALSGAPVNAGTYYAKASVAASDTFTAATSSAVKVTITKAAQKMTATAAKTSVKTNTKKAQTIKMTVKNAQGKVTYTSSNKKYVTVSTKGVITVKKGAKAGKYTITVKAAGNGNYNALTKKVTITVKK